MFRRNRPVVFLAAFAVAQAVSAADFFVHEDPVFENNSPGADGLWTAAERDATEVPGTNPTGSASYQDTPSPFPDCFVGGSSSVVSTGGNAQVLVGVNDAANFALTEVCLGSTRTPIDTLDPNGTSTVTVSGTTAGTNVFTTDLDVLYGGDANFPVSVTTINSYTMINDGSAPAQVFPGNQAVIDHFDVILPSLPPNWLVVTTDLVTVAGTDSRGPVPIPFSVFQSVTQLSIQPEAIPAAAAAAPVPVPALPAVLLGAGLVGVTVLTRRRLRRSA